MEINSMKNETITYEQNENEYIINISFNSSEIKFNIQKGKQYQLLNLKQILLLVN